MAATKPTGPAKDAAVITTSAKPVEPARSRGLGGLLAASLVGGLIGAGLVFGADRYLLPPRSDSALAGRLDTLEKRVAALPSAAPAASGALDSRLAALETGLKQVSDEARAARAAADAAAKQAAEVAARPAQVSGPAPDPALREAITALTARADESAQQGRSNAAAITDLGGKVTDLGGKVDAFGTRTNDGLAAATAATAALGGTIRSVQGDIQVLKTGAGALDARSAEAETRLAALSTDLGRVSSDLSKLSPAASQAGLRMVVAGRLDESLRAGVPLGPVLAVLTRLGTDPAALKALQPFADAPPPSAGTLAAEFKPLAEKMTTVSRPAQEETWRDRVWRVLGGIVTVRAVGDGSGQDVPGIVGRIETALGRGALAAAAAAWDQLPADAKAVSAEWAGRLKARLAADEAARSISSAALAALAGAAR